MSLVSEHWYDRAIAAEAKLAAYVIEIESLHEGYGRKLMILEAKLADIEQSYRQSIESPCSDEQHCTCVPALRTEVASLETAIILTHYHVFGPGQHPDPVAITRKLQLEIESLRRLAISLREERDSLRPRVEDVLAGVVGSADRIPG